MKLILLALLIALILWLIFRDRGGDDDDRGPKDQTPDPTEDGDAEKPKAKQREDA